MTWPNPTQNLTPFSFFIKLNRFLQVLTKFSMVLETRLTKEAIKENLEKIKYQKLKKQGPEHRTREK